MRLHRVVTDIAERQLGLATLSQLCADVAPSTVQQASEAERLRRLERSVYLAPGSPISVETRILAKVLSAGDGAVLSHRSAAWLWKLIDEPPPMVDVSVPRRRRPRTPGIRLHQSRDLHLIVTGSRRGIPVTDVGRTILDCAGEPDVDVQLLIDAARRNYGISPTVLPWVVASHARPGRRGIRALRDCLELDEMPHSDFERLTTRWLHRVGITGWHLHHRLVVPGYGACEPDIAWPEERVILELEGADHRDRSTVHANDTSRQNALVLAGWVVLRVTYRRWLRHTERVQAEVESALHEARSRQR